MKRMLHALLGWLLCRGSSDQVQEVRENSVGIQAKGNVFLLDNPYQAPSRPGVTVDHKIEIQAREDYEYLKTKRNPQTDLATISRTRYDGLLKLAFIDQEVNDWLDSQNFIFLDAATNIGIIRC